MRPLYTQMMLLVSFFAESGAFIFPSLTPTHYTTGQPVAVLAVELTSIHTQMPYEYYDIQFCPPPGGSIVYTTENLEEALRGHRVVTTPYELITNVNESCKFVCQKTWDAGETEKVIKRIQLDHRVHMLVDNLPVATPIIFNDGIVQHESGYALGLYYKDNATIINNHLSFTVKYHTEDEKTFRVVGLEVQPTSTATSTGERGSDGSSHIKVLRNPLPAVLEAGKENLVLFTYDVQWHRSDQRWASRLDSYLTPLKSRLRWISILNSLVVVLFMSGVQSVNIKRLLSSNIAQCHRDDQQDVEKALEESDWKPVHGDVLRRLSLRIVFAVLLGTGLHLRTMAFLLTSLVMSGKPFETSRGLSFTSAVLFYVSLGLLGGCIAGRIYRRLKGTNWKHAALVISLVYPLVLLGTYFILNYFTWDRHSSRAVPFTIGNAVLFLWLGVSMPLNFIGFFFGYKRQVKEPVESTWKLVYGEVFRPPSCLLLLTGLLGTGLQLMAMVFILIFLAVLEMRSAAFRGSPLTPAVLLYVFMGLFGGYFAGRMYKTLEGTKWKHAALVTSLCYPSVFLGSCFIRNFCIWHRHSSGMVPFTTMIAVLFLWLGVSMPLTFIGYFFGYRKQPYTHPVETNEIPRQVPAKVWYLHPIPASLLAGILPFGVMFIELSFVFSALWQNQLYDLFGFLFLVYVLVVISCCLFSILMVYYQLCAEDYHWWWQSFIVSGGCAFYLFAYSVFYFFNKLSIIGFIPSLLYFGCSVLVAFTFWILTGTVGFFAAYSFVRKIYGSVKIV